MLERPLYIFERVQKCYKTFKRFVTCYNGLFNFSMLYNMLYDMFERFAPGLTNQCIKREKPHPAARAPLAPIESQYLFEIVNQTS